MRKLQSLLICSSVVGFALSSAQHSLAYNGVTHARMAELAVRAMNASKAGHSDIPVPADEQELFATYLAAIAHAPSKLELLRAGLPLRQGDGALVTDESYPFDGSAGKECVVRRDETRDLTQIEAFRVIDLYPYRPQYEADACGLLVPKEDEEKPDDYEDPDAEAGYNKRPLEIVMGIHAKGADYHQHDTELWLRPTNSFFVQNYLELTSNLWETVGGSFLAPIMCFGRLLTGNTCDLNAGYDVMEDANPIEALQAWVPGVYEHRNALYNTFWHFIAVDAVRQSHNNPRGLLYEHAGPRVESSMGELVNKPGAIDLAIIAVSDITGASVHVDGSNGVAQFGQFDDDHRPWHDWQAHTIGHLEFSPIQNMAAYGWERFLSEGAQSAGPLTWPLHALGDASAPHHIAGTSSWGHRPFENFVDHNADIFFPRGGAAQREQLQRIVLTGFWAWKLLRSGVGAKGLTVELATWAKTQMEGQWAYEDVSSIVEASKYVAGVVVPVEDADKKAEQRSEELYAANVFSNPANILTTRGLLEASAGAILGLLTEASAHVGSPPRADIDCPGGTFFSPAYESGPGCDDRSSSPPPKDELVIK